MKVFLIVVAVIAVIVTALLSLSVTVTIVYDKKWSTKVKILFIEKEIELSKVLSFLLFPEKSAEQAVKEQEEKKNSPTTDAEDKIETEVEEKAVEANEKKIEDKDESKPKKPNPIAKLWDEQGIVGIFSLVTNLVETANSAIITLIRGLHIYSLYVMIIVGGYDADMIGRVYGKICQYYYPFKGIILNQMRVDNYDDYITPDFLAERTETEFQLIASMNVKLVLKLALKAGYVFLKNLIKNKKEFEK